MLRYMRADMHRFTRQKTRMIYILFILLVIVLLGFCAKKFNWGDNIYNMVISYIIASYPIIIGTTIFIALFSDDFRYKTIQQIIGRGLSRSKYVIAKFLECILITVFYMLLVVGAYFLSIKVFGIAVTSEETMTIFTTALQSILQTVGYISITMILVFNWQNLTMGLWIFSALAAGLISTGVSMIFMFDFLPKEFSVVTKYLFSNMLDAFIKSMTKGQFNIIIIPAILIYIVLPVIITCNLFKSVELDF